MFKVLFTFAVTLGMSPFANALGFDEVVRNITTWDQTHGYVYYGQVTNHNGDYYQCLSVAFISAENGVLEYYHKMWPRNPSTLDCEYTSAARLTPNRGQCVSDGKANSRVIDGNVIDRSSATFRVINMNNHATLLPGGDTAKARGAGQPECSEPDKEGWSSLMPGEPTIDTTSEGRWLTFRMNNKLAYRAFLGR